MLFTSQAKKLVIASVIAVVIPLVVVLPLYYCSDFGLSNSLAIVGVIYLGFSGLYLVTRAGIFDTFRYQFINWMYSFKRKSPKRYADNYSYRQHLKEQREGDKWTFIPFVIVGILLVIGSIIASRILLH